jgi:gluconate 2-dehydrogenase gamma chain
LLNKGAFVMTSEKKTRREFLASSGSVMGTSFLALNMPLILSACDQAQNNFKADAEYENITLEQAVELGAIADQIIPEDESPGATQTGVVYFMDAAFGGFMAGVLPRLKQGLDDIQQKVSSADARVERFSDLSFDQQTTLLRAEEDTSFFELIRFLTICGMFCLPQYGGNRDQEGWKLLGFDHRHSWQAPFGYYDTLVHNGADKNGGEHDKA